VMEIAADEIGGKLPIIHGVWADGSQEAARIARAATAGGASALLVFPRGPFTLGQNAEMAGRRRHFNLRHPGGPEPDR